MSLWRDIGIILGLSLVLSLASFGLRPATVPLNADEFELDLAAAMEMPDAIWVDARTSEEFESGTYRRSILVNEEDWEGGFARLLEVWQPGQPIIVFCGTDACVRSRSVADRLRKELGVEEAYSLRNGWDALLEAGLVKEAKR